MQCFTVLLAGLQCSNIHDVMEAEKFGKANRPEDFQSWFTTAAAQALYGQGFLNNIPSAAAFSGSDVNKTLVIKGDEAFVDGIRQQVV